MMIWWKFLDKVQSSFLGWDVVNEVVDKSSGKNYQNVVLW